MIEVREKAALKREADEEDHLKMYRELRERIVIKTYLHGPVDATKCLELRFRVTDPDTCQKEKEIHQESSGGGSRCTELPCGKATESRTHVVAEHELYKEKRDVLEEEMRGVNTGGMKSFEAADSSEKTVDILGDRRWPQTAK